jgi:hypothetical protein
VSTDPDEICVRLDVDVDVHIAPKVRQLTAPSSSAMNKLSITRRIYPRLAAENTLEAITILPSVLYVHPDTLPTSIDNNGNSNDDDGNNWVSGQLVQISTIQLDRMDKETTPIDENRSECTIALLQVDKRISPGVALGGSLIWSALKLKQCERVKWVLLYIRIICILIVH